MSELTTPEDVARYCDPRWSRRPAFVAELCALSGSSISAPRLWSCAAVCIFLRVVCKFDQEVVEKFRAHNIHGRTLLRLSSFAIEQLLRDTNDIILIRGVVLALRFFFNYSDPTLELPAGVLPFTVPTRRMVPSFVSDLGSTLASRKKLFESVARSVFSFLPGFIDSPSRPLEEPDQVDEKVAISLQMPSSDTQYSRAVQECIDFDKGIIESYVHDESELDWNFIGSFFSYGDYVC